MFITVFGKLGAELGVLISCLMAERDSSCTFCSIRVVKHLETGLGQAL